ncbi:replication protein A 70 kDa DNA-binding subunit [Senna tora]|uniref:Replication protein A 70 kDa DNA-binding subunit n=1 Tax=Senna tora TaxID=362788 RepID=A0A834T8Q9_9FABA|nr:replication protein A 70 kDa DNA-binding subunit [Senna tora]
MYASRMFINSNIPEITEFHKCLRPEEMTSLINPDIYNSGVPASPLEAAFSDFSLSTIQDLFLAGDSSLLVILASILQINSDRGWFYDSCSRYKIDLMVLDHTGTANIIVFDRDAFDILGITAMDLRKENLQNMEDTRKLPQRFDSLLGKTFLFKVSVRGSTWNGPPSFTVQKMTCDPGLIEKFTRFAKLKEAKDNGDDCNQVSAEIVDLVSVDDGLYTPVQSKSVVISNMDARMLSFADDEASPSSIHPVNCKRTSAEFASAADGEVDPDGVSDMRFKKIKEEKK